MATIWATKAGNWSDTTIWSGGAVPTSSDDVYANGYTVSVNANVTVKSLRTQANAGSGVAAGGTFQLVGSYDITTSAGIFSGTSVCVTSNNSVVNTVISSNATGGSAINIYGVNLTSSALTTVIFTGNAFGGTAQGTAGFRVTASNVDIVHVGDATGGGAVQAVGIYLSGATFTFTGTGNYTGGNVAQNAIGNGAHGLIFTGFNNSTATVTGTFQGGDNFNCGVYVTNSTNSVVTCDGIATGGNGTNVNFTAAGVRNDSVSTTVRVTSAVASGLNPGVYGSSTATTTVEQMTFSSGTTPIFNNVRLKSVSGNSISLLDEDGNTVTLTKESDSANQLPPPNKVEYGYSYNQGNFVGTLRVPNPSDVRIGVPVGSGVGTAELTAADLYGYLISNPVVPGSVLERILQTSTIASTGDQIAAITL